MCGGLQEVGLHSATGVHPGGDPEGTPWSGTDIGLVDIEAGITICVTSTLFYHNNSSAICIV
jgi:hypothetical protein